MILPSDSWSQIMKGLIVTRLVVLVSRICSYCTFQYKPLPDIDAHHMVEMPEGISQLLELLHEKENIDSIDT